MSVIYMLLHPEAIYNSAVRVITGENTSILYDNTGWPFLCKKGGKLSFTERVNTKSCIKLNYSLERLAVVNDSNHVLYITLRKLSVSQVLLFVDYRLLSVSTHNTHTC